ncbi:MAG: peptidoglycan-associated lipoprotein Pal [Acidobacteria bacterium]|nr:MAG: peptidoglycan-associated lipoprotein Pal [Acidobacteriota bacterium]
MRISHVSRNLSTVLLFSMLVGACGGKSNRPPATTSVPPTQPTADPAPPPERPPEVIDTPPPMVEPGDDLLMIDEGDPLGIRDMPLDAINDLSPLADVPFDFDSATLLDEARVTLNAHAKILAQYDSLTVLIEGHCDERGTVEYNLALGERRANAVYNYLMNLGISASRLKTISYGKEFPKDPSHDAQAWAANRRGHFEITGK